MLNGKQWHSTYENSKVAYKSTNKTNAKNIQFIQRLKTKTNKLQMSNYVQVIVKNDKFIRPECVAM